MRFNRTKLIKTETIFIRTTKYEKKQLEQEAARRGMTQSELIRSLIVRFPAPVQFGHLRTSDDPALYPTPKRMWVLRRLL